ncbi:MAG: tRNA uridine-5-carboxymethylaminomethyl(34) synthesis GTPase MnmE [Ignavibacteria bacterium]
MVTLSDTIAAISTPLGEGGIAVIRISGFEAFRTIERHFFKDLKRTKRLDINTVSSHTIHFGYFFDEAELIDEVLISIFKEPNSYTGENLVEISAHGSTLIAQKILQTLLKKNVRLAQPGEFTKRAFLNGKIDLSQAEAVADLIRAKTDIAHKSSLQQLEGSLSQYIHTVRKDIIDAISLVELELDFAEEDIEFIPKGNLKEKLISIKNNLNRILETFITGKTIREGVHLVIAGKPNSGKSSLFNHLLQTERAIVSNISGTTRDFLQENRIINGILFNLIDTAGLRQTTDIVESIGIEKSYEKIQSADFSLYLIDSTISKEHIIEELKYFRQTFDPTKSLPVLTKIDATKLELESFKEIIKISIYDEKTIENLKLAFTQKITETSLKLQSGEIILTNFRHKICLENVAHSLNAAIDSIDNNMSGEFISVDLRNALNHLGEITGEVTNEEILNNIFQNFCIGK